MDLARFLSAELSAPAPAAITALVAVLADPSRDDAILYYGSTLRTGDLSGVLDFYRLTQRPHRRGMRGLLERGLWPEVSYREVLIEGRMLRAKIATLPMSTFRRAARNQTLDTTIWARFVQPAQLVWSADARAAQATMDAVVGAVETASRYAAALGPAAGSAEAFWTALFRRTYAAEFRVEDGSRADQVMAAAKARYVAILPLAWRSAGIVFAAHDGVLRPSRRGLPRWALRRLLGKPLNLARLAKAAFTFDGAARYAAWKIERHTGVAIPVTPFRERHPILAAPEVFWRLRAAQAEARRARLSRPNS